MYCQKQYINGIGEIYKTRLGLYTWNFFFPKIEKAMFKGISLSLYKAIKNCDQVNSKLAGWVVL